MTLETLTPFCDVARQGYVRLDYPHPDRVYHSTVGEQANLGELNGGTATGASVAGTKGRRSRTEATVDDEAVSNA